MSTLVCDLLSELGLAYRDTLADRRGSTTLRVSRGGRHMVLKLPERGSRYHAGLLKHETEILREATHVTGGLYVDHGEIGGRYWLLLREIIGEPMYTVCERLRGGGVDAGRTTHGLLYLLKRVVDFYAELYRHGFLHGDVQPAHLFLEDEQVRAIDWALASRIGEPNPYYRGAFVHFVSPQVAVQMLSGCECVSYTPADEVYAIGATLYFLYTGSLLASFGPLGGGYMSASLTEKLQHITHTDPASFGAFKHLPERLEDVLRTCLTHKSGDRYSHPAMLQSAFAAV